MTSSMKATDLSKIVKAYDIRGIAYEELTVEVAEALGAAFADLLDAGDLVVSHDMRVSSPDLASAFARGAVRRGSTVAFAGLSSTDQLYCASGLFHAAGAQFTASHNPAPDNGIKMCFAGAKPVGRKTGLLEVQKQAESYLDAGEIALREGGRIEQVDTLDDYVSKVLELVEVPPHRTLKVVVDAANAMAGHTVPAIAKRLDFLNIVPLYFELDGTFPHHEANPLDYRNLHDLQARVKAEKADLGLAFDGDADRCIVVDEMGQVVSPSAITAMIAHSEIDRAQKAGELTPVIIANAVSSRGVREVVEASGARYRRTRVGHSIIKDIMAEENAIFGGEHSAHYYFRDFYFADSGMLAALHVLRALAMSNTPLSDLVAEYDPYVASGEINTRVNCVEEAVSRALDAVHDLEVEVDELDGVSVTHWPAQGPDEEQWWFSLRASNTEPLLRLNVEAARRATMENIRDRVLDAIRGNKDEPASEDSAKPLGHNTGDTASHIASDIAEDKEQGADLKWAASLVRCPGCLGILHSRDTEYVCESCGTVYPVEDGIAMLIKRH